MICNKCWKIETERANKLFRMGCFREASKIYLKLFNGYKNLKRVECSTTSKEIFINIDRYIITTNNIIECMRAADNTDSLYSLVERAYENIKRLKVKETFKDSDLVQRLELRLKAVQNLYIDEEPPIINSNSFNEAFYAYSNSY